MYTAHCLINFDVLLVYLKGNRNQKKKKKNQLNMIFSVLKNYEFLEIALWPRTNIVLLPEKIGVLI